MFEKAVQGVGGIPPRLATSPPPCSSKTEFGCVNQKKAKFFERGNKIFDRGRKTSKKGSKIHDRGSNTSKRGSKIFDRGSKSSNENGKSYSAVFIAITISNDKEKDSKFTKIE
uniref:Uncharacterized protein n=1 Tax=Paramoeba aestuarina TaxID=180227 RepID=A0A7S4L4D0_9EUKA